MWDAVLLGVGRVLNEKGLSPSVRSRPLWCHPGALQIAKCCVFQASKSSNKTHLIGNDWKPIFELRVAFSVSSNFKLYLMMQCFHHAFTFSHFSLSHLIRCFGGSGGSCAVHVIVDFCHVPETHGDTVHDWSMIAIRVTNGHKTEEAVACSSHPVLCSKRPAQAT